MPESPGFEVIETKERVLADNAAQAGKVRALLERQGTFFVNLMSSPGAGKTSVLVRTIEALKDKYRIGVMEADVDSDVDAKAVMGAGAKAVQIHTGGACHMDADMTLRGLLALGTEDLDLVFLENVGNLVCPAEFDVGADLRVMILSVPEGDDKPLKYPLMFTVSDCLLVNKTDVEPVFNFSEERCLKRAGKLNPDIAFFPVSAKTGEGFDAWLQWLSLQVEKKHGKDH